MVDWLGWGLVKGSWLYGWGCWAGFGAGSGAFEKYIKLFIVIFIKFTYQVFYLIYFKFKKLEFLIQNLIKITWSV